MQIRSPAFEHEGKIPSQFTCDGANVCPPLRFEGIPDGTQTLALILDDHDVPRNVRPDGVWDHWVVYNIAPDVREVEEGAEPVGRHGVGTGGNENYFGPCPPDREHRYVFTLYALDASLNLPEPPTKSQVLVAMEGHVLDTARLIGRYQRNR